MNATDALQLFLSTLSVSLPTFGWVFLGLALNRLGWLPEALNNRISLLAFRYGLPLMLFAGAAQVDYAGFSSSRYLLAGVLATLLVVAMSWGYSRWRGHPLEKRGIFVQAAYRSNLAIVGLALAVAAYGPLGTQLGALPVALMTMLYNVIAVWVLAATLGGEARPLDMLRDIARNPLIIGIVAGVALSVSPLPVPAVVAPAGNVLSAFFLPLVLTCIGASMKLSGLYRADALTWEASLWRLVVAPLVAMAVAYALGVRDAQLGVLFLLVASPVAASSHVMVVAARGDGVLAANIIVLTTLLSMVTVTLGLFLLSLASLVGALS